MVQRLIALLLLILFLPILAILYVLVKLTSHGPFIFKQKRMGKDKKIFTIYKIRTMVENAERLKSKYMYLNEHEYPIFKIRNDPRYTVVGKHVAHSGLDELPQLLNIVKGQMSFIGPRPLPADEAKNIPKKYMNRYTVLPGLIPPWIQTGAKAMTTNKWLDLEYEYIKNKSLSQDIRIFIKGLGNLVRILRSGI